MNTLTATGTSQNGLIAALAIPMATAHAVPQTPAFVNMISMFLSPPTQTAAPAVQLGSPVASPKQLADSMIRSMLGNVSSGSTSAAYTNAPQASSSQIADSLIRSMLGNSLPQPATNQLEVANLPEQPAEEPTVTPAPSTDALIQSLLKDPLKSQTTTAPALPEALDTRKQRNVADLLPPTAAPLTLSLVSTAPAPEASVAPPSPAPTSQAVASTSAKPELAASPAPIAKSDIAFEAVLTPIKETPRQPATSSTIASPNSFSASVTPVSAPPPNTVAPSQPSAATPLLIERDSTGTQTGGNGQQSSGDGPSQEKDDAVPVLIPSESKNKPAVAKQQDSEVATAAPAPALVATTPLTSFPDQTRAEAVTTPAAPAPAPTPFQSAAEAIRTAEPTAPEPPPLRTGAAQEISIRIASPDAVPIDLRVVERGGQVHVDVRTSDGGLQTSLRQDLGTLSNSLERAGYHSETFTPSSTLNGAASSEQSGNQDHQDSSQNQSGSGSFSDGRRQQQQQQQQKRPSTWLEEMEEQ